MASALNWIPDTLYNYSLATVAVNYDAYKKDLYTFPENMLFDIFYQLYKKSHLKQLGLEFSNVTIFRRLLKVKDKSILLHNCFQAIMDYGDPIADKLATAYQNACKSALSSTCSSKLDVVQLGFSLGDFLVEAGWFLESEKIFLACLALCETINSDQIWRMDLQCYTRLLRVRNSYSMFKEAKSTLDKAQKFVQNIKNLRLPANFAGIYSEFSFYYYCISDYNEAYKWSIEALQELKSSLHPKEIIRVLCQASKAAILKKLNKRSEILIKQALYLAREHFSATDVVYANVLSVYGHHLTSTDDSDTGVQVLQTALNLLTGVFGGNNLLVAKCHDEFAFALYIAEYNTGKYKDALAHADKSLNIIQNLCVKNKFLFISGKRIKALILEEMAIDSFDEEEQYKIFAEALELHQFGFNCIFDEFGETNLLLAKYYGNLGRLYQSMKEYQKAENHYFKAIAVMKSLLKPEDYEMAVSFEHLASLYAYDMKLYEEAEVLYLKSLEIFKKHFGEGYSQLEYHYKGLLIIYTKLNRPNKVSEFRTIYLKFKELREIATEVRTNFSPQNENLVPIAPENLVSHLTDF